MILARRIRGEFAQFLVYFNSVILFFIFQTAPENPEDPKDPEVTVVTEVTE
jgi:hypothetical protein